MQRNRADHRYLRALLLFAAGLLYEPIAALYGYPTPLLGFWFYYLLHRIDDPDYRIRNLLVLLYILYVEIDRGWIPFSFLLFFLGFYLMIYKNWGERILCSRCTLLLYIPIGYLGYYLWNLFLAYLLHLPMPLFGATWLIAIISDILLGWWLL